MPTPESAESFARLVAARARLGEVTKLLNASHAGLLSDGQAGRQRHAELQAEWDETFKAFEKATDEFATNITRVYQDVEAHRLPTY